jgi:diadenosine tetraphosphatase ApaH/serine/threonine PP2A family protein phosphatase
VHGSPLDEDEYLMTNADVEAIRREIETPLSFFGHTHLQGGFLIARNGVKPIEQHRALELEHDYRYLVNPGSVGQPRDADPRAAYAIYSPRDRVVEFRRVAYDVELAAEKIRAAGLPETLASRLLTGV